MSCICLNDCFLAKTFYEEPNQKGEQRRLALDKQEIWAAMLHEVKYSYDGRYSKTYPYGVVQRIAQGPVDPRGVRPWRCRLIARDVANVAVVHLANAVDALASLNSPKILCSLRKQYQYVCHRTNSWPRGHESKWSRRSKHTGSSGSGRANRPSGQVPPDSGPQNRLCCNIAGTRCNRDNSTGRTTVQTPRRRPIPHMVANDVHHNPHTTLVTLLHQQLKV